MPRACVWSPDVACRLVHINTCYLEAVIRDHSTILGVICRDEEGKVVVAWVDQLDPGPTLSGEAQAFLLAVECAKVAKLNCVVFKRNSLSVIPSL